MLIPSPSTLSENGDSVLAARRGQTTVVGQVPPRSDRAGRTRRSVNWLEGAGDDEPRPALWPLRSPDFVPLLQDDYRLDVDPLAHVITYREGAKHVNMLWGPEAGMGLYFDTIRFWTDDSGSRTPVSEDEQVEIARRTIRHVRSALGIDLVLK